MKWKKNELENDSVREYARTYNCDILHAVIMLRRDVHEGQEYFLDHDFCAHLYESFLLPGMEDAVDRILQAGEDGEKVLVFGDRDVDGIASIVLMVEALEKLGCSAIWKLPMYDEPYGLDRHVVEEFAEQEGTLIVAVDCGSTNYDAVQTAHEQGIDIVIFDHHGLQEAELQATALVNPALKTSQYPHSTLCTAAIIMKFYEALSFSQTSWYKQNVCLLHVRPGNDSLFIDVVKLRNLVEIDRISETLVSGLASLEDSRLLPFLEGMPIFVFDVEKQIDSLQRFFGNKIDFNFQDIAPTLREAHAEFKGKNFLQIQEQSSFTRYKKGNSEIDMLVVLFFDYHSRVNPAPREACSESIDLAALATLADMMPLNNENRHIVRYGMQQMQKKKRLGLQQLFSLVDMQAASYSQSLSWRITPIINASGRMGRADKAVSLLLAKDNTDTLSYARDLVALNEQRKKVADAAWNIASLESYESKKLHHNNLILVYNEAIHRGVTGIIASRLSRSFYVPAVIITRIREYCIGSVRSGHNFHATEFLQNFEDLFIGWGGHDGAAGFHLKLEDMEIFKERVQQYCQHMEPLESIEPTIAIDAELPATHLSPDIIQTVNLFEPYGMAWQPLKFLSSNMYIESLTIIGRDEKHFKFLFSYGRYKWPAVYWNAVKDAGATFKQGDYVNVVFEIFQDNYSQGRTSLNVIDMHVIKK